MEHSKTVIRLACFEPVMIYILCFYLVWMKTIIISKLCSFSQKTFVTSRVNIVKFDLSIWPMCCIRESNTTKSPACLAKQ
jgi:hypothetical protein